MKSFEFTGRTFQQAIEKGLAELGKKQEEVDIQILSEGGFFKKAKVLISFEDEPLKTNFRNIEVDNQTKQKNEESLNNDVAKTSEEQKTQVFEAVIHDEATYSNQPQKDDVQVEKLEPLNEQKFEQNMQQKVEEKQQKDFQQHKNQAVPKSQEEIAEKQRAFAEKHYQNNSTSVNFVDGLLKTMNINAAVTLEEKRDASEVLIETEDAGKVIGHRGEGLSAIQYLANIIENNANPNAKRIVVDAGDYKQRREESLRALAIKIASRVETTGKPYKFDPMNAFERRIIHTELHNYASVETHSEGVEPNRRIIVTKKK